VFDWICHDSCYTKQSQDELSFKKKTWFICWSETTLAVWYTVFLELCVAPALWNVQVTFFLVAPKLLSSYILRQLLLWSVVWHMKCCLEASVTAASLHITPSTGYFKRLHRNYRSYKHRSTGVSSILFITILTCFGPFGPSSGVTYKFTRSNTVYNNLLTVIMFWWTYLVLKPSKIVLT